jgi:hypothetical protein
METVENIVIPDGRLSRSHVTLIPDVRGGLRVRDLDSTNGTLLGRDILCGATCDIFERTVFRVGDVVGVLVPGDQASRDSSTALSGELEWSGESVASRALISDFLALPDHGPFWIQCANSEEGMIAVRGLSSKHHRALYLHDKVPHVSEPCFRLIWADEWGKEPTLEENVIVLEVVEDEHEEAPRSDAFAYLNVPSLRARLEDVMILVMAGLEQRRGEPCVFSVDAAHQLLLHDWSPGIAELHRILDDIARVLRPAEQLDTPNLDYCSVAEMPEFVDPAGPPESLKDQLVRTLTDNLGSVRKTAVEFDVDRTQVYRWLKRYKIDPNKFRRDASAGS